MAFLRFSVCYFDVFVFKETVYSHLGELSGLHTANLSWQTRVGKHQKVDKLFPSHVKLVSNNKHGNLQHGRFFTAVAVTYNCQTEEKKRRNRKRWGNGKVWTKPSLSARSPVLFCLFLVSLSAIDEASRIAEQL